MSRKSRAGKQEWQVRADGYAEQLPAEIDRDARTRLASWDAQGKRPAWFRVKARLSGSRRSTSLSAAVSPHLIGPLAEC